MNPDSFQHLLIRADSGTDVGSGHIMRCLALADNLKFKFKEISFVSNQQSGHLSEFIESKGFTVHKLINYDNIEDSQQNFSSLTTKEDAIQTIEIIKEKIKKPVWLIVDNYNIDIQWESFLRKEVEKIIVIDDLANRSHDCDLLLDQNLYDNMEERYNGLIPKNCQKLFGPKFALLRSEFKKIRKTITKRHDGIQRIFISFGGSDPTNETSKAIKATSLLGMRNLKVDVIVGSSNPNKDSIRQLCSNLHNTSFYHQIDNIAELMSKADVGIGAGGSMTWERCCVGLPAIVSVISQNQLKIATTMAQRGYLINLGEADFLSPIDYTKAIQRFDKELLCSMSEKCMNLVDGEGSERVVKEICLM